MNIESIKTSGYGLCESKISNRTEKEEFEQKDIFQKSSVSENYEKMDMKFSEIPKEHFGEEDKKIPETNNSMGTIVEFRESSSVENIKPSSPLYEVRQGEDKEEKIKLAETMIYEGGLDPRVKKTVIRDLSAFPLPVLRLLKNDALDIIVVKEGQSLADTSFLLEVKPQEYQELAKKGKKIFDEVVKTENQNTEKEIEEEKKKGNDDPFHIEMMRYWASENISNNLSEKLIGANLGFTSVKTKDPINLKEFSEKHNVSDEDYEEWEKTFKMINEGHIEIRDGMIEAKNGVFLSPYTYYHGKPVSETTLQSLKHYDSKNIKDALGIHNWEDRLIMLHEEYAADPGKEVGHYRIILHECGHALDHAIERIPGEIGEEHRKIIDEFYRKDMEEFKKGGKNNFISPRAMDNVREYFAEAVESYLTVNMEDSQEYYKKDNNHSNLNRLNPELLAYIDKIMKTDFPADLKPVPPVKTK